VIELSVTVTNTKWLEGREEGMGGGMLFRSISAFSFLVKCPIWFVSGGFISDHSVVRNS